MDDFTIAMRKALGELATQLTENPFGAVIYFDGRFLPRAQARALERTLWPLAYPEWSARRRAA